MLWVCVLSTQNDQSSYFKYICLYGSEDWVVIDCDVRNTFRTDFIADDMSIFSYYIGTNQLCQILFWNLYVNSIKMSTNNPHWSSGSWNSLSLYYKHGIFPIVNYNKHEEYWVHRPYQPLKYLYGGLVLHFM